MNIILKVLFNTSLCISAVSTVMIFLYFCITRKIHAICLVSVDIFDYFSFFIFLFFFALSLFLSILLVLIVKTNFFRKKEPFTFWLHFGLWYDKINIFYKTYGLLFDYIGPRYIMYLVKFTKNFLKLSKKTRHLLVIFFVVVPRFIILMLLFLELHLGQLHYYFYSLFLLLIPFFFKFMVFILKDIGPRLLPKFKKYLEIDDSNKNPNFIETPCGKKRVQIFGLRFKKEHRNQMDLEEFLETFYNPLLVIGPKMSIYFIPFYSRISTYTILLYLGFHVLAWSYVFSYFLILCLIIPS